MKPLLKITLITLSVLSASAQALELGKESVTHSVPVTKSASNSQKTVSLMSVNLSDREKSNVFKNMRKKTDFTGFSASNYPSSVRLGMNNVPVLDQGNHGSCVTFAAAGAIDAILGHGDYVSPLCSLELGSYLEQNGHMESGWNGAFGNIVLDQMFRFGIINMENQRKNSCAGMTEYPGQDEDNIGNMMTPEEYFKMSESPLDFNGEATWVWSPIMNVFERFNRFEDETYAKTTLNKVKESLTNGHRVVFGTLIVTSDSCNHIICAQHKVKADTFALTDEMRHSGSMVGGHEMIITGYDDQAVAKDISGKKHKGLLILRNSWGDSVGDNGDFYMTYEYFLKFVMEAHKVWR